LGDYLRWAQSVGCTVQASYGRTADGEMVLVTRIEAPDGKWVVEVGTEQHEFLAPTTVSRFDRRLGLKSPFASLP